MNTDQPGSETSIDAVQKYDVGDYVYLELDEATRKRSGERKWSQVGQVWDVMPPQDKRGRRRWKYRIRLVSWCVDHPGYPSQLASYPAGELKKASKRVFDEALDEVVQQCIGLIPGETAYEWHKGKREKLVILVGPFNRLITRKGYKPLMIDVGGTVIDVNKLHYRWGHGRSAIDIIAQKAGRPPRKIRIEHTMVSAASVLAQPLRREWPQLRVNPRPAL